MPNWCSNSIRVSPKGYNLAISYSFMLALMSYYPFFTLSAVKGKAPNDTDSYDWNVKNYGTKWDIDPVAWKIEIDDVDYWYTLWVTFDTAWSPATPVVEQLSIEYPQLVFTHAYCEMGMDYLGVDQWQAGEKTVIEDSAPSEYDWDDEDPYSMPETPSDLAEFLEANRIHLGG